LPFFGKPWMQSEEELFPNFTFFCYFIDCQFEGIGVSIINVSDIHPLKSQ
jgi:hypothetical protein